MPPDSTAELPPITRPSLRISIPPASRPSRPPRASRASPISSISPISPRDYSHSDYTPRDPLEAVYDWNTRTFSYKRHSKIEQSAIQARIAKGAKKLEVKPRNIRDECGINIVRPPTPPITPPPTSPPHPPQDPPSKNGPLSLSYNWKSQKFSYKKLSEIDQKDATRIEIGKGVKVVEIRPRVDTNKHKKVLLVRMVELPKRVVLGRKMGMFESLEPLLIASIVSKSAVEEVAMSEFCESTPARGVEEILSPQPLSNLCINEILAESETEEHEFGGCLIEQEKVYMCMVPAAEYGVALDRKVEVELPDEVVTGWKEGRFKLFDDESEQTCTGSEPSESSLIHLSCVRGRSAADAPPTTSSQQPQIEQHIYFCHYLDAHRSGQEVSYQYRNQSSGIFFQYCFPQKKPGWTCRIITSLSRLPNAAMSLYDPPETLKMRNREKSKESSSSGPSQIALHGLPSHPKQDLKKDSKDAKRNPHDTLELVYHWHSSTFSYKRLSKLDKYACGVPIPRFSKKVRLTPWGAKFESSRMVELPRKVYFGRNLLRRFETVWIEDRDRREKEMRGSGESPASFSRV
ncbi:uncharacterized protein PAC_11270 [Phialocephala subalpina]|uniref:Uncharacterized protein n=1 Tax=Phialocephala subalpina TaxID=576137 RepID=A0A1L7X8M9_9HELO|nr:uncharacterized protein PAC_11270 [Phialocephala subalpina]